MAEEISSQCLECDCTDVRLVDEVTLVESPKLSGAVIETHTRMHGKRSG